MEQLADLQADEQQAENAGQALQPDRETRLRRPFDLAGDADQQHAPAAQAKASQFRSGKLPTGFGRDQRIDGHASEPPTSMTTARPVTMRMPHTRGRSRIGAGGGAREPERDQEPGDRKASDLHQAEIEPVDQTALEVVMKL